MIADQAVTAERWYKSGMSVPHWAADHQGQEGEEEDEATGENWKTFLG